MTSTIRTIRTSLTDALTEVTTSPEMMNTAAYDEYVLEAYDVATDLGLHDLAETISQVLDADALMGAETMPRPAAVTVAAASLSAILDTL